jgi:hypothetical protein
MSKILTTGTLTADILTDLLANKLYCIHIPQSLNDTETQNLVLAIAALQHNKNDYKAVARTPQGEQYVDYGISFIGAKSNKATGTDYSSTEWQEYFDDCIKFNKLLLSFEPKKFPIQRLLYQLNELHTCGAGVANFNNKIAFYGGFRFTKPGTLLQDHPHIDPPRVELHNDFSYSVNVYLSMPKCGRDLLIWDNAPPYNPKHGNIDNYLHKYTFGLEPKRVYVQESDMVIFNSSVPHGVSSFRSEESIAQQSFFVGSPHQPIQFYN